MQYEAPRAQRPVGPQRPEQHCALDVQTLFAVTHVGFGTMGAQVPFWQLPVQHALPAAGHASPIVTHWMSLHVPETQAPLQQSVLPTQAAVAGAQCVIDEAQVPVVGSHRPEQHDGLAVHA
jgi:hypothetical protein